MKDGVIFTNISQSVSCGVICLKMASNEQSFCDLVTIMRGELIIKRLAVPIPAPTAHMFEVSLGKTLNPILPSMGAGSTTHGSSYPLVCKA